MLPCLLLVDDEEDMLDFLERMLKNEYTIFRALDGKDALEIVDKEAIQLIVSDVMMPVMDGFELCRRVKSDVEHSHIPVILLTAKNTIQAKVEGLELGADAYIDKPFSAEHLRAQIHSLLSNRNMIRKYFSSSPLVNIRSMAHSRADEKFLEALNDSIQLHIEEMDLDVEKLARIMNMSRVTLYRKIKAVSDLSPLELINITRLKKAAELLAEGEFKIYEIADRVGYSSQSNFSRHFLKQFNMTPTDYMQMLQKQSRKLA